MCYCIALPRSTVISGLEPGIQPNAGAWASGEVDPGDKRPEDVEDNVIAGEDLFADTNPA